MLPRLTGLLCVVALVSSFSLQAPERVDTAATARIRDEGLNRSQVMETAFWLTDRYGPRLSGSPELEEAGEWAMDRLRSWGVSNVRKERFPSGRGWSLVNFHATMLEPRVMPLIGMPKAWTPGIGGTVTAEVVRPTIASEADAAKYRGTLRGKIVLVQPPRAVRMFEHGDGTVLRYDDQGGKWRQEAMRPPPPPSVAPLERPAPAGPETTPPRRRGRRLSALAPSTGAKACSRCSTTVTPRTSPAAAATCHGCSSGRTAAPSS